MPARKTTTGKQAEHAALQFLLQKGLRCREMNFRSRFGEIDLVMDDGETLVFVEVRMRRNSDFGGAVASVTARKQQRLVSTAAIYLERHRVGHRPVRFDIVAFEGEPAEPRWLQAAFRPES